MTKIRYGRTFNLGNYESEKIEVEQEFSLVLNTTEISHEVWALRDLVQALCIESEATRIARQVQREPEQK